MGLSLPIVQAPMAGGWTTPELVAAVSDAGGIMDGRGVIAALALGAEAAQLGTRFLLARESGATPASRRRLLESDETDIVVTDAYTGRPARGIRNRFLDRMTEQGGTPLPWPRQGALGAAAEIMRELAATAREVRERLPQW
jgi:NAD(P)H-dependent flavin oxidoreductase YrpB (nitropropane dioxygenase family)